MLQLASILIIHEYIIAGLKKILLFSMNCSQIWLNPLHRNGLRAVVLLAPTAKTNSSARFPRAFAVLLQRNSVSVAHSLSCMNVSYRRVTFPGATLNHRIVCMDLVLGCN
jgi:hypothetical protein